MEKSDRALIIIGGKEDRSNNKVILQGSYLRKNRNQEGINHEE